MSDKTYIKGLFVKSVDTRYGEIIKLSVKLDTAIEHLRELQNEKGYVNIDIIKKKEPGRYGDTHYCILNEYKKDTHDTSNTNTQTNVEVNGNTQDNDDLPF